MTIQDLIQIHFWITLIKRYNNNNTTGGWMILLIFWLSLITGTLIAMLTGYIFTSLFLFLIFGISVAYNFTK